MEGLVIYNNNKNNKKINPSFSFQFFSVFSIENLIKKTVKEVCNSFFSEDERDVVDLILRNIFGRKFLHKKTIKNLSKEERAKARLEKKKFCGLYGNPTLIENKAIYTPARCGCVTCEYCSKKEAQRVLNKYFDYFKSLLKKGEKLSFVTLTVKSSFDLKDQYQKIDKALRRLYQIRLFKNRTWKKIRKEYQKELREYTKNLAREKYSNKEERKKKTLEKIRIEILKKYRKHRFYFKKFEDLYKDSLEINSDLRIGQYFPAVWRLELTYDEKKGYHLHWHSIWLRFFPKLLLNVLWKKVTNGDGRIEDVRKVKGEKGILELNKYVCKHWIINRLPDEKILEVETVLFNVKKIRFWHLDEIKLEAEIEEKEEEKNKEILWYLDAKIEKTEKSKKSWLVLFDNKEKLEKVFNKYKNNIRDIWYLVKKMRDKNLEKVYYGDIVFELRKRKMRTEVFLSDKGDLIFSDKINEFLKTVKKMGDFVLEKINNLSLVNVKSRNSEEKDLSWIEEKWREIEKKLDFNEKDLPF
ncbi:MAG: hypothetical protein DRP29_08740 [Thermodesulfobacteriota bacterium]|nr:MAG: hypothetical protein DRP29_08740 [Thermodesulfobacteriota bacterium]